MVFSVSFSADGKTLASGGYDHTIRLWDPIRGRERRVLSGHEDAVPAVAYSPDGKLLASGGRDGTVRFWSPTSGKQLELRRCGPGRSQRGQIERLVFSPDGWLVAWVNQSADTICFWDLRRHEEIRRLQEPAYKLYETTTIAFSPDDRRFGWGLAQGGGSSIYILDLPDGKRPRELRGHTNYVLSLVFSPDGRTLVSGGNDDTMRVWDIKTGKARQVIEHTVTRFVSGFIRRLFD